MKFYLFDLDLNPVTLVLTLDLDIIKMCELKMRFLASVVQKL